MNDRALAVLVAIFEHALVQELETLQRFLAALERLIEEESRKGPLRTGQKVIDVDELMDHDYDFSRGFPSVLRMSLVLSIHGLIENQTRVLVEELQAGLDLEKIPDQKHKSWVQKRARFLCEGAGLGSGDLDEAWEPMHLYNDVRNTIAHDYGFLGQNETRDKRICERIAQRTDARIDTNDRLELDADFVETQLEDSHRLVREIAATLYERFGVDPGEQAQFDPE